jgi:hypothetical protein
VTSCWLAGFTEAGESDSRLWVTDLSRADPYEYYLYMREVNGTQRIVASWLATEL